MSCTTLEDTVVNMMKHPGSTTIVVQLYSGELFELHGGMLEPWGSVDMRVSFLMLKQTNRHEYRQTNMQTERHTN